MRGKKGERMYYIFCTNGRWKRLGADNFTKMERYGKAIDGGEKPHWIRESTLFKYVQHFEPGGLQ